MANNKTPDFQTFWDAYALKRDRIAAERAWKRLTIKEQKAAIEGIETYRNDCQRRGIHMMYAQGYLNHHRWEDEQDVGPVKHQVVLSQGNSNIVSAIPSAEALDDMGKW